MRVVYAIAFCCLFLAGCSQPEDADSGSSTSDSSTSAKGSEEAIIRTNATEKLVLELQPRLKRFAAVFTGKLAPEDASDLFYDTVAIRSVTPTSKEPAAELESSNADFHKVDLNVEANEEIVAGTEAAEKIRDSALSAVGKSSAIQEPGFGILSGELSDDQSTFVMETLFEGKCKGDGSLIHGIKGYQEIVWKMDSNNEWKIAQWKQNSFTRKSARKPLFEDVTAKSFDKPITEYFDSSKHYDLILKRARDSDMPARLGRFFKYFVDWHSMFRYTSCSVVDIDQDGWDDLFVADRWGTGKLLRNKGDGTFEDITESSGLDLSQTVANCTLFVDFDNDGDSDALIGQSVNPATFYRNENGKFVPDEQVNKYIRRCKFVTSASAVDINRDGLIDVYISTYVTGGSQDFGWLEYAVDPSDLEELKKRVLKSHSYLDRCGPPNVVLMNRDGNLEEVRVDDTLRQWKCSYQSVWADIDNDGDSDLYICNDFAPDALLRNDTPRGSFEPKFTDISKENFAGGEMGFGMGASFGDYDSDGDLDLYVSNMYSKAGNRIFRQLDGDVNQQLRLAAQGNFLFRNNSGVFKQVAGLEEGDQHVSKVGWSFGGQFADFNNDQKLDVYVPSGFFTPPEQVDSKADL